jgi:hypothetical protein
MTIGEGHAACGFLLRVGQELGACRFLRDSQGVSFLYAHTQRGLYKNWLRPMCRVAGDF